MIEIITHLNRSQHTNDLDDMFEQRYRILIRELGWDVPDILPGRDEDAFDTKDTIYLIARHPETGQLTASCRLNPTEKPHLMSEVFPNQCDLLGIPRGPNIWELSRLVYDRSRLAGSQLKETRVSIRLAIVRFCQAANIHQISWLTNRNLFAGAMRFWPTRPLGGAQYYDADKQHYVAAISEMNEEALTKSQASYDELLEEDLVLSSQIPSTAWDMPVISAIGSRPS